MSYTPGPWRKQGNIIWGNEIALCVAKLFALGHEQEKYNALLISAAPDLLETMKYLKQTVHQAHHNGPMEECRKNTCQAMTAVILKAEGNTP